MDQLTTFQAINLILNFGVVPVIYGIYRLNQTVNDLDVTINKDFVTKTEFYRELDKKQSKRGL